MDDLDAGKNLLRLKLLNYKIHEHRIGEAWKRFENAGFKPLLIKGWAAAQYYDEPSARHFTDVDIVISPEDYRRAETFLEEESVGATIDLHRGVRRLDTVSFKDLYANSQKIRCGAADIRVLCREDHLRILCVHWLLDGGENQERLLDIYYAVRSRPSDFDWERCLNVVNRKRRKWIICTIKLAEKYLDLDVGGTPIAESRIQIPRWLSETIEKEWRSGVSIIPLDFLLNDRKRLWTQIKKRVPPNPIQATVEMEGEFDSKPRIFYQIGDMVYRLPASVKRIIKKLKGENS